MSEIIGVRFKDAGKVYYFDPNGVIFKKDDNVVVETVRGVECGIVAMDNRSVDDEQIVRPLKKIIRKATPQDMEKVEANRKKEKEAFAVCEKKILAHGLDMKLIDVEYTMDCSKMLFYFTADGRVDFRELVKDLAAAFRTRIELRQIGVRDETKRLGGLGICGRAYCCNTFLGDFQPVSIKMAKEQGLSLNPVKISGSCGRLMCCLKYEHDAYEYLLKITPKPGALVETKDGQGTVTEISLIRGIVKVQLKSRPEGQPQAYNRRDVRILKDGRFEVKKEEMEAFKGME